MIGVRSIVRSVPVARRAIQQTRNFNDASSVIAGPPQVQISTAEKIAHGVFLGAALLATPAWVLLHLKEYKGEK